MNTEDFKLECAECYLTDECDAMYGGENPPCTEVVLQSASSNTTNAEIVLRLKDLNKYCDEYMSRSDMQYVKTELNAVIAQLSAIC